MPRATSAKVNASTVEKELAERGVQTVPGEVLSLAKVLSPVQFKFALARLDGHSQTSAYKIARGAAYSEEQPDQSARAGGWRWSTNVNIAGFINAMRSHTASERFLSREEKREYLARQVRTSVKDVWNEDGTLCDEHADLVVEVEYDEKTGQPKKVKKMSQKDAIALDNAMTGDNAKQEIEVTQKSGLTLEEMAAQSPAFAEALRKKLEQIDAAAKNESA